MRPQNLFLDFLTKLNKNAITAFGMKKGDEFVVGTFFGSFMDHGKPAFFEPVDFFVNIIHLECDMVYALAPLSDEF